MTFKSVLAALALGACVTPAIAHDTKPVPQSHAPIGVMADHRHGAGEFMLSYRYMRMRMSGTRDGTSDFGPASVTANFGHPVVPTDMNMDMHMFGAMLGLTDAVTAMVMIPYLSNTMDHLIVPMDRRFTTSSKGAGDIKISALVGTDLSDSARFHIQAGFTLPTGSIDERDDTPAMANAVLPYPMQLGSGTYDFIGNATLVLGHDATRGGVQFSTTVRTGENRRDYRLGNKYEATAFVGHQLNDWFSVSGRVIGKHVGSIKGADPRLNPMMVQTANPDNHGGEWLSLGAGVNFIVPEGQLKGQRLAIEFTAPVYQNLNGPQLKTRWTLTAGWQYALNLF